MGRRRENRRRKVVRKDEGYSKAETSIKDARYGEVRTGAEFAVCRILKSSGFDTFLKSGARVVAAWY